MIQPLDLNSLTKIWRITMEETWKYVKRLDEEKANRNFYKEIKGKYGVIYPFDNNELRVIVVSAAIGNRLGRILGQEISRKMGDEVIFSFTPERLNEVAGVIKARYCRGMKPLTPEQREKQKASLEQWKAKREAKESGFQIGEHQQNTELIFDLIQNE